MAVLDNLDPQEGIELLQESIRNKRRLIELAKQNGLAFYRPHAKQDQFHRAGEKRRGYFAGNRAGKSTVSCAETIAWALGERTWYKSSFDVLDKDGAVFRHHNGSQHAPEVTSGIPGHPTKQLIITTDWDKVDEIWTSQRGDNSGKIWRLCPQGTIKSTKRNHSGAIETIEFNTGSLIRFDTEESFKRNPQGSESSDWDRVAVDEPITNDQWKASARGLVDRNGQGDFTLTPLREMWMYDYFYGDAAATEKDPQPVHGRFAIRGSIYDNPYLSQVAIAEFERDLTDDERQARLYGIPLELSGLVYKEFSRERHVLKTLPEGWKDWHLPAKNCILYARVDPHPQVPHAVLFLAIGPDQNPILCHELFIPCDADALEDNINDYVRSTGLFLADIKVDPAAWVKDSVTRMACVADKMAAKGLIIQPASKDKSNGILNMRSVLKRDSGVRFVPTLRRTLWEISRYCYDKENKPIDANDHMMENMYRMFITPPFWFDPDSAAGYAIGDMDFSTRDLSSIV